MELQQLPAKNMQHARWVTYQSHEEEENLEAAPHACDAGNVTVPHRRHRHHQKVDAVPVGETLAVVEVGRVPRVFQLQKEKGEGSLVRLTL